MGELIRLDDGKRLPEPRNALEVEIIEMDTQLGLRATEADLQMARRLAQIASIINAQNNRQSDS